MAAEYYTGPDGSKQVRNYPTPDGGTFSGAVADIPKATPPAGTVRYVLNPDGKSYSPESPTGNPIIDSGIRRHVTPSSDPSYASAAEKYFSGLDITTPDATEQEKIRQDTLRQIQAQLDTIDAAYAGKLAAEVVRGTGRSGQGRSINARSGLLGSDMGAQRDASITEINKGAEEAIRNEQAAAKAAVLDKANQRAFEQIQLETTKALTNAGQYLTFMQQKQTEARADIGILAKAGVTLDQLDDNEYAKLLNQSGYGSEFLFGAVYNSQLPANAKRDYEYVNLGGGKVAAFDKLTGKPTLYDYSIPEGYQFKMAGDIPVFVNEKTQDVKIAAPGGDLAAAGAYAKETELDSYTNANNKRVSVLYNPITHQTRTIVTGTAKDTTGGYPTGFKPQPFEVSAVSQFIASEGSKQEQTQAQIQQAITAAQQDPTFFYSVLTTITGDKKFSDLYYKPQTVGVPAAYVNDLTPAE